MRIQTVHNGRQEAIAELLKLESDDLYAEFAKDIGDLSVVEEAKDLVDSWINDREEWLQREICAKHQYCTFVLNNKNLKRVSIIAAVADTIAPLIGSVPINTLAILLVQYYLDDICMCDS